MRGGVMGTAEVRARARRGGVHSIYRNVHNTKIAQRLRKATGLVRGLERLRPSDARMRTPRATHILCRRLCRLMVVIRAMGAARE